MRKQVFTHVILMMLLLCTIVVQADISIQYKCGETNPGTTQIKPHINIINTNGTSINFQDLIVRYYYSKEGTSSETLNIDHAAIGSTNINGSFKDGYLELSFSSSAGSIPGNGQSGEIQIRLNKNDYSNYDQSNDYSFDPTKTTFSQWDRIVVYRDGIIVWGVEPGMTSEPTAVPTTVPTMTPQPTDNPDGYTLHVLSEGAPQAIPVKYFGDLTGNNTTPFDIQSSSPYTIHLEPGIIDIKEDFTSGYYLWNWEGHPFYGYETDAWNYPIERQRFYQSSPTEVSKNLSFVRYDDPVILPSPYPTPMGTPPPPLEIHYNIVDSESGLIIQSPDILVELYDYYRLSIMHSWTTSKISERLGYYDMGMKLIFVISAPGYHTLITDYIYSSIYSAPKDILLYKTSLATPEPDNTPVATQRPTPTPGPNTVPEWRYIVDTYPPEVEFRFHTKAEAIISLTLPHTGVRVFDWGRAVVSGHTITVNPKLIVWDGAAPRWNTTMQHSYSLGNLSPGQTYTLFIEEWSTPIESFSFRAEPLIGAIPGYEAPWSLNREPTLDMEYVVDGNTYVTLTANFFEFVLGHSVLSWGEVSQAGTIFTVNPTIIRNEDSGAAAAVRYCSTTYDLGILDQGDYTFKVVIGGREVMSHSLKIVQNPSPSPAIRALPTSTPIPHPRVKVFISQDKVQHPDSGFIVSVKNYGQPCTVGTHEWFTDHFLSISPSQLNLNTGESADFTVTINWDTYMGEEERTSYNAFIVTTSTSGYRQYEPWEVVLQNPHRSGYTISGKVAIHAGILLTLSGDLYMETRPDSTGYYEFNNIPEGGNYVVSVSYTPPCPVATILTPAQGEVISGIYDVTFLAESSYCDYAFTPNQYSYSDLQNNTENQDFAIGAVTGCCMLINEASFLINNVYTYRDYTESMCSHTYTWSFDTSEYTDGEHTLKVRAKDETHCLGIDDVTITISNQGPTPEPTPTHPPGTGNIWFVPKTKTVHTDEEVSLEIHINSGLRKIAAYGFTLYWDNTILRDLMIEEGPDGFLSAPATHDAGHQTISGFDFNGTGPGSDLSFLNLQFRAGPHAGITLINLDIHILKAPDTETIGTPNSTSARVTVLSQAKTGDVNNDGNVDIVDALLTAQYYVGLNPSNFDITAADVNCDGYIDIVDALLIAQFYVGLDVTFC